MRVRVLSAVAGAGLAATAACSLLVDTGELVGEANVTDASDADRRELLDEAGNVLDAGGGAGGEAGNTSPDAAGDDASAARDATDDRGPPPPLAVRGSTTGRAALAAPGLTIEKPSGTRVGDLLVAFVVHDNEGTVAVPAGWTRIATVLEGTTGTDEVRHHAFYRVATSADTSRTSYDFVVGEGVPMAGGILAVAGASTTQPVRMSSTNIGSGARSCTFSAVSPGVAPTLVLLGCGFNFESAVSASPPAGATEAWEVSSSSLEGVASHVSWFAWSSPGDTGGRAATLTGVAENTTGFTIAIQGAGVP